MKKLFILPLITLLGFSVINIGQDAEAKNKHKIPPGQAKKMRNVTYVTPRYYVAPRVAPRPVTVAPIVYTAPLVTYRPGVYYFTTQSPAYLSRQYAISRGYGGTTISFFNNRWTLTIR